MKSRTLSITAITLLAALAIPARLAAQHTRFKLIDIDTFGGPNSTVFVADDNYNPVLNNRGTVTGFADTPIPDPFPNFPFFDGFVSHAFQWQNGAKTDLDALKEGVSSASDWISANGLIAGWSENGLIDPGVFPGLGFPELHAVLWKNGKIVDLGTLEGEEGFESVALAVNSRGQVVGAADDGVPDPNPITASNFGWTTRTRAFLWQDGIMRDLGTLGGPDAVALLVNERGQVAGDSYISTAQSPTCIFPIATGAFLWENGTMVGLPGLGGTCTFVFDLNNRGQVVGASRSAEDIQHPVLWDRGVITDLGTFAGKLGKGNAIAINNAGEITGFAEEPGNQAFFHSFLWKNGVMTDLGALEGDPCNFGFSINARGQVVGISVPGCDFANETRAFLWEHGGPMVDLNTLIPPDSALHLAVPDTINDRGEISGFGLLPNGDVHAFLLIPCGKGTEVCGNEVASATATRQSKSTLTAAQRLAIRRMMAGSRTRLAGIPGLRAPKD